MFATFLRPGQEVREFIVKRPSANETDRGRVVTGSYMRIGAIKAVLAEAKPEEKERWRQLDHPVSHQIIMRGKPPFTVKPGDMLILGKRRFYLQTMPDDPGGLGHWMIFHCDERFDM